MGRAHSPAESLFVDLLSRAVTPVLKPAGFRKSGMNFHRRHGTTVQVVNFQSSTASTWSEEQFYVNVGISFDAVCQLVGVPVLDKPKEYECDERGFRCRLGQLIEAEPASWVLRDGERTDALVTALGGCIQQLREQLDRIDGPAAYRAHPWFELFRRAPVNPQVLYLLGDLDGAWHDVCEIARGFSDRQNANRPEWWVEKLGLKKLEGREVTG